MNVDELKKIIREVVEEVLGERPGRSSVHRRHRTSIPVQDTHLDVPIHRLRRPAEPVHRVDDEGYAQPLDRGDYVDCSDCFGLGDDPDTHGRCKTCRGRGAVPPGT